MDLFLMALSETDFQWTSHIDSIWRDAPTDIPELQFTARERLTARLASLSRSQETSSPLGVPLLGTGGSGKTHLLSAVRRQAFERGQYFVLVDMTDVRDFWETVLLGYLRSLDQQHQGLTQFERLLRGLTQQLGPDMPSFEELAAARPPGLVNRCDQLIRALAKLHRTEAREHQDVLRALVLMASTDDDLQGYGYDWLQGNAITETGALVHGFLDSQKKPDQIVRGLSWLMSLHAPTVIALDQLDAIVAEHNLASTSLPDAELTARQLASLSIIQGISGGLSALRDVTRRTLMVVSSLEATWEVLDKRSPVTMKDRYEPPLLLQPIREANSIRNLIERRLATSYSQHGVKPGYASYPFKGSFFTERIGLLPREVLKACNDHRYVCAAAGKVTEIGVEARPIDPDPVDLTKAKQDFDAALKVADVRWMLQKQDEDSLDKLIEIACEALVEENPLPESLDPLIDKDFLGSGSFEPLHARLRIVDRAANDRELHYAFRFLEKTHHIAFQGRLKAAITASGIDQELPFRRLAILRTTKLPHGALSEKLLAELTKRGGLVLVPTEAELKVLAALKALLIGDAQREARCRQWLRRERPVSKLPLFRDALGHLFGREATPPPPAPTLVPSNPSPKTQPPVSTLPAPTPDDRGPLQLGVSRSLAATAVRLEPEQLKRHVAVLGGSGSGKTTLALSVLERLLLQGVPVVLVDRKGDLCRYGDPDLAAHAAPGSPLAALLARTDVAVFTPGDDRGRSLSISLLPAGLEQLPAAERNDAYKDSAAGIAAMLRLKGSGQDEAKQAILVQALRILGESGSASTATLSALIELIGGEDPALLESLGQIDPKHCKKLGEALTSMSIMRGELLSKDGDPLSAELLFGMGAHRAAGRARLSIISTKFLGDDAGVLFWVSQLLMELNRFASRSPSPHLQGAVMFDEADIYLPATSKPPTKGPLESLLKRARSAGIAVVLATQSPGDLDYKCRENVRNWFVGLVKEPRALDKLRPLLSDAKLDASAVLPKQKVGQFFLVSETAATPFVADMNVLETKQLSEPEILRIAAARR